MDCFYIKWRHFSSLYSAGLAAQGNPQNSGIPVNHLMRHNSINQISALDKWDNLSVSSRIHRHLSEEMQVREEVFHVVL